MSACLQKSQPFWNARQSPFINNKGSRAKEGENLSSSHPTIKEQTYFVKPLTPDSFTVLLPTFLLESLKPFCLGEKVDFSRVGKMPNIHGNLEFFHFLYMFNWDLHKIINERTHYEHSLWRGEKGSCLEVKFWSLYPASLENTWEISLPTAGPLKQLVLAFRILKGRPTNCSLIADEALSSRRGLENTGLCVGVWGLRSVCLGAHCPPPTAPSLRPFPTTRDSLLFTLGRLQLLFLNV